MKVTLAKDAGFCFGVRDAVKLAEETAAEHGKVNMLGHIVHNERVVRRLSDKGVKVVDSFDDVSDAPVLFRAHGTSTDVWDKAKDTGVEIIDATCPLVTEIHREVRSLEDEGRRVIIIGDHGHDEVVGIASQVEEPIIVSSPEEAASLRKMKRAGAVSQSTQTIENVQAILNVLVTRVKDLRFINTICFPTRRNQEEIKQLAVEHDLMVIIGSFTSANTKRLTSLARTLNPNTYQVEAASDIDASWFGGVETVGVSAGASTPDIVIGEVMERLQEIGEQRPAVGEKAAAG